MPRVRTERLLKICGAAKLELEPSQGTFDFSTLDGSLAAVTAYNVQHPSAPLGVRLRVFGAYAAPEWAKMLDGTPITVPAHPPSNTGSTLGQWWKSGYRTAWAGLQQALAARYDSNTVLDEVAVSSCTTLTAEPFVMAPSTIAAATADGWTPAAQQACLDGAFTDYALWTHTAIYYPMNPLSGNQSITTEVMQRCANSTTSGGPWCVLANNALSPTSATTDRSAPVYAEMNTLWSANPTGTPIALQMNAPNNSTYCAAIGVAVNYHAQSVELWPAGPTRIYHRATRHTRSVEQRTQDRRCADLLIVCCDRVPTENLWCGCQNLIRAVHLGLLPR